jgi:hypothetical protein
MDIGYVGEMRDRERAREREREKESERKRARESSRYEQPPTGTDIDWRNSKEEALILWVSAETGVGERERPRGRERKIDWESERQ